MSCSIFLHFFGVFDKAIKCFKTDGEDCPTMATYRNNLAEAKKVLANKTK
jgi:hypothetical protein